MSDSDTRRRLEKLERLEQGNRDRVKRYMDKAKKQGKKQISAIISREAYDTLCRIRDKAIQAEEPVSFGQIIEKSIPFYEDSLKQADDTISISINDSIKQAEPTGKPVIETQQEIPGPGPEPKRPDLGDMPDKARIIELMSEYRAAGDSWQAVADKLNGQGILTARGEAWTKANAQAFYSRNKKAKK